MPVAVFCIFLHRRKSISNGVQTPRNFLWIFYGPEDSRWAKSAPRGAPRGHAQVGCAHLGGLPHPLFALYILKYFKNPGKEPRSEVPPPQAFVATENQSGSHSDTLLEGEIITGGHLHHPEGHHNDEGVVHPRG